MATQTKRPPKKRPVQHPKRQVEQRRARRSWRWAGLAAAVALAIAVPAALVATGEGEETAGTPARLPDTPDYHSLLVARDDADTLTLGTHNGLYQSSDGGRSWQAGALEGQDAMSLARASDAVWAAGHLVLAKSVDGGQTWQDVRPAGLPSLDVHGFAADPRDPEVLYAAIAGAGLYRSEDGGASFTLVSADVGPGVMALALSADGRILAGDMQRGLLVSVDRGATWTVALEGGVAGLAVNPEDPDLVLGTGPGVVRSTDGGRTWRQVMSLEQGAGPVAWAPGDPDTAYVVGYDRTLYESSDGGRTWLPVD